MPSRDEVQGLSSISEPRAKSSRRAAFALEQSSVSEPPKNENRYGIICLDNPAVTGSSEVRNYPRWGVPSENGRGSAASNER